MRIHFWFLYCLILASNLVAAQNLKPEYSKVHFVYERKSNYQIVEKGVYADTLLLKIDFPEHQFLKVKSPRDSTEIVGFVPIEKFSSKQKKKLAGALYHTTERIAGTHDFEKNITKLEINRDDKNMRETFKKDLNESYPKFRYSITIDYNKKMVFKRLPNVSYDRKFATELKTIEFNANSKLSGYYTVTIEMLQLDNFVVLKEGLNNKIVPDVIFSNNEFGVAKIATIQETMELKSVTFE